ncbi:Uncharacterised protein [Mycobacteroides abscessus subsp. abscessus]|nr:Uncharacterised protein [Mycobacteroides abscessus subsp. abscessus]
MSSYRRHQCEIRCPANGVRTRSGATIRRRPPHGRYHGIRLERRGCRTFPRRHLGGQCGRRRGSARLRSGDPAGPGLRVRGGSGALGRARCGGSSHLAPATPARRGPGRDRRRGAAGLLAGRRFIPGRHPRGRHRPVAGARHVRIQSARRPACPGRGHGAARGDLEHPERRELGGATGRGRPCRSTALRGARAVRYQRHQPT